MKRILGAVVATALIVAAVQATEEATWGQVKQDQRFEFAGKMSNRQAGGPISYVVRMIGNSDPSDFTAVFPEIPEPDNSFLKTLDWSWIQTGTFAGARGEQVTVAGEEIEICSHVRGYGVLKGNLAGLSEATYYFEAIGMAVSGTKVVITGKVTSAHVVLGDPAYAAGDEMLIWIEDGSVDRKLALWSVDTFKTLNPDADFDTHGPGVGLMALVSKEGSVITPYGATTPFEWQNGGVYFRQF